VSTDLPSSGSPPYTASPAEPAPFPTEDHHRPRREGRRSRQPPETEEIRKEKETNRSVQTKKKRDRSENKEEEIKTYYCLVCFSPFAGDSDHHCR
jgi:hypothetical protein